ncbi:MAG: hypothetical protein NTV34_12195 [Proteobacteria bacterium]|nr:hypothetical protein [Pseudomonadota bacterium]
MNAAPVIRDLEIREIEISDIAALSNFFKRAYGHDTAFQSPDFLKSYFSSRRIGSRSLTTSVVCIDANGDVNSHYGTIFFDALMCGISRPVSWGVNAFTLPEWRGKGINRKIVEMIQARNEINCVMGMTYETTKFYAGLGYNVFEFETHCRYAYVLDCRTYDLIESFGQDARTAKALIPFRAQDETLNRPFHDVVRLTKANIDGFSLNLESTLTVDFTTNRTKDFIKWRLIYNPYIKYSVFAVLDGPAIVAYIALRAEQLMPTEFQAHRIVDVYGQKESVIKLLHYAIQESRAGRFIYLDFSKFGSLYDEEFLEAKFSRLDGDNYCLLPQVSSPMENRPNNEFVGIHSFPHRDAVAGLTKNNVYLTRIDGDRDRVATIQQVRSTVE